MTEQQGPTTDEQVPGAAEADAPSKRDDEATSKAADENIATDEAEENLPDLEG